jgi:alkanesulfonate monooxygenase SsuD/methylene tetrahydromethanopterin reductase-like flavin-dependent oxidoreductase (luciferase family)
MGPRKYDFLTTLTYVAGVTKRILLGTSIIDMFFQNPVLLRKRFATLDILSDGRTIAGLEMGWLKDEYRRSLPRMGEEMMRTNIVNTADPKRMEFFIVF